MQKECFCFKDHLVMGFKRSWKHCWDFAKSLFCAVSVTAQHSLDAFHCLHFSPPAQLYTHSLFSKHKLTDRPRDNNSYKLKIAISEKIPSSPSWVRKGHLRLVL